MAEKENTKNASSTGVLPFAVTGQPSCRLTSGPRSPLAPVVRRYISKAEQQCSALLIYLTIAP